MSHFSLLLCGSDHTSSFGVLSCAFVPALLFPFPFPFAFAFDG